MESLRVSDYMNHHPVIFRAEMPVAEAVERLLSSNQFGGPVLDDNNKVVGFVSEQDCLKHMVESSYYREQVARVKDIMRKDVLTTKPYHSVLELAQQMISDRPKLYPVLDDDGGLLGIIGRTDVLNAIDVQLHDGYRRAK